MVKFVFENPIIKKGLRQPTIVFNYLKLYKYGTAKNGTLRYITSTVNNGNKHDIISTRINIKLY